MARDTYYKDKVQRDEKHYYYTPIGKLPSVTMITGVIDDGKSGALVGWAVRETCNFIEKHFPGEGTLVGHPVIRDVLALARKEATRQKDAAANVGKIVHDMIEWNIRATYFGETEKERVAVRDDQVLLVNNAINAYEKFAKHSGFKPEVSESMVYSKAHKYGGTLDIIATGRFYRRKNPMRYLIDIKTGTVLPLSHGAQLAAYAEAWEEMHGEKIDGIAVLQLDKETGLPKWHDFTKDRAKRWKTFRAARKLWETINNAKGRGRK